MVSKSRFDARRSSVGNDRLAEVAMRWLAGRTRSSSNCRGELTPDRPRADRQRRRASRGPMPTARIATAAHPIVDARELFNPNVVKTVLRCLRAGAVFLACADSVDARCVSANAGQRRARPRVALVTAAVSGLSPCPVCTPTESVSCASIPGCLWRQSNRPRRSSSCATVARRTDRGTDYRRCARRQASIRPPISSAHGRFW